MDHKDTLEYIDKEFESNVIPTLMDYVRIDNLSPAYDPEWETNGKAEKAANLLLTWALNQGVKGIKGEILKKKGLSPVIFLEIEPQGGEGNVFMYGHFDKQPHFDGWLEGTGPTSPVIIGDLLYGRGGADDGYAIFSSLLSIKTLQAKGLKHGKATILIEGSEESGSIHLFPYIDDLKERIGNPSLLVCLDSGCKDYERIWVTTSLRGVVIKDLEVTCLKEAVHSGLGSGQGPDSFTVIRELLDRLEDSKTGAVTQELHVQIPESKFVEAKNIADILGDKFALVKLEDGVEFLHKDLSKLYLAGTWYPTLTVVGQSGLPAHNVAGNVLRGTTSVRISLRIPPTKDPEEASKIIDEILLKNPPHNAKVTIVSKGAGSGFASADFSEKLIGSLNNSSNALLGKPTQTYGEGGSIPFLNSLSQKFPQAEFVVIGVLGPGSNAHAANETLNIPFCKKITVTLTHAIYDIFN